MFVYRKSRHEVLEAQVYASLVRFAIVKAYGIDPVSFYRFDQQRIANVYHLSERYLPVFAVHAGVHATQAVIHLAPFRADKRQHAVAVVHAKLSLAARGAGQHGHDGFGGHGLGRTAFGQGQIIDGRTRVFQWKKHAVVGKGYGKVVLQRAAYAFRSKGKGTAEIHPCLP